MIPWIPLDSLLPCRLSGILLCFDSFTKQLKPCYQLGGRNPSKLGECWGFPLPLRCSQEEHDGNVLCAT